MSPRCRIHAAIPISLITDSNAMRTPVTISPRGLNIKQAAAYWGVSRGSFLTLVERGVAPQPMDLGLKRNVYDRVALDAAMTARAQKIGGGA